MNIKIYTRFIRRKINIILGNDFHIRPTINLETEFHGSEYGGWAVLKNSLNKNSLIISAGVGEDASFDLSLIAKYGCTIHAYDPTPKSAEWVRSNILEPRFEFEEFALAEHDGCIKLYFPRLDNYVSASCREGDSTKGDFFEAPCFRLGSIIKRLAMDKIDIVKMDIEGAEYGVINDAVNTGEIHRVKQLLVEFHHFFSSFNIQDTKNAIKQLRECGFEIAWVSEIGHEVLFVKQENNNH